MWTIRPTQVGVDNVLVITELEWVAGVHVSYAVPATLRKGEARRASGQTSIAVRAGNFQSVNPEVTQIEIRRMFGAESLTGVSCVDVNNHARRESVGASQADALDSRGRLSQLPSAGRAAQRLAQRRRIEEFSPRNAIPAEDRGLGGRRIIDLDVIGFAVKLCGTGGIVVGVSRHTIVVKKARLADPAQHELGRRIDPVGGNDIASES